MSTAGAEIERRVAPCCSGCGTQLAPKLLSCPSCGQLVHASELKRLAELAAAATHASEPLNAVVAWREALELLPPNSQQHATVSAEVDRLTLLIETTGGASRTQKPGAPAAGKSTRSQIAAALGLALMFALKFKTLLFVLLTKGKLLLLGLTKGSTFFSMLASVGAYWTMWGWKFAVGFVVSLYVHEMGHVAALRRFGIRASAPMFLPGIGAFVRLGQAPVSPREDARIGLAGPWWGAAAAFGCYAVFLVTGHKLFAALAHTGALLNLFNLVPIWQLDGARAFRAMSRVQRWLATAAVAAALVLSGQHLLLLVLAVGVLRCFGRDLPPEGDLRATADFAILIGALTALSMLQVAPALAH